MGLKEVLSKMKIVEMADEPPPSVLDVPARPAAGGTAPGPGKMPGQPTDIRDLLGTIPPPREIDEKVLVREQEKALEKAGAAGAGEGSGGGGDIPDFDAVYRAAGITDPPHGYTAYKVLEILNSSDLANLDSRAKAAALAGFLKMNPAGPVPITDVVQDAVRRDQALDKFEEFLRGKLRTRTDQIEEENRRLQAEIDELARRNREKMDANRKELGSEEERFARWQVTKRIEERKLFDAVAPFVEANPISTGEARTPAPEPPKPQEIEGTQG